MIHNLSNDLTQLKLSHLQKQKLCIFLVNDEQPSDSFFVFCILLFIDESL